MLIGEDRKIRFLNPLLAKMLGYKESELLNKRFDRLIPKRYRNHTRLHTAYLKNMKPRPMGSGPEVLSTHQEIFAVRKDGREIAVEISLVPVKSDKQAMVGVIVRDVTERKQAESADRRLGSIVESSDDAIIGKTLEGIITSWNIGAEKIYGYKADEVLGKSISILVPPDYSNDIGKILRRVSKGQPVQHYETKRQRKDGTILDVSLTVSPIKTADGKIVGASAIARDITRYKKNREALRQAYVAQENMLETISDGFLNLDKNWICTYLNTNAAIMLGKKPNQLLGKEIWDEFPEAVGGPFYEAHQRAMATQKAVELEEYYPPLDKWYWVKIYPSEDSLSTYLADITERKEAEEQVKYVTYHDSLTGLPNRLLLDNTFSEMLKEARIVGQKIAIFFIDLSNYKQIKNTLGYDFAEKLLIKTTRQIEALLPDGDRLGKIGESQYAVFMPISEREEAIDFALNIVRLFESPWRIAKQKITLIVNIGIAVFPEDGEITKTLFENAELAASQATKEGFNNYAIFNSEMSLSKEQTYERLVLSSKLSSAIKNREMVIYYQPIVNVKINEIIGVEALVRWQRPNKQVITPDKFIPLAEKTGQIIALGNFVFAAACKQNNEWQQQGFSYLKMSINLSAKQLMQKDLLDELCRSQAGKGNNLILEITESDIMKNPELAIRTMNHLKESNFMLSIDDFGTGYASLSYLKKFPVDFLKIDKSFTDNIVTNRKDQAIVSSTIEMAHGLGLLVIAEGVETEQQRAFLSQLGCDELQGYLFGEPMLASDLLEFLKRPRHRAA